MLILQKIMHRSATKTITVQYVAVLKEQSNRYIEVVKTEAMTCRDLYQDLQKKYQFSIPIVHMRVAVNHEFCSMEKQLEDQDLVIFIPPVCGG
jgi:molybdopterin synthase sulfur carrier subunit